MLSPLPDEQSFNDFLQELYPALNQLQSVSPTLENAGD